MSDPLHALVCNCFGYDKSIVRGLALYVRRRDDVPEFYRKLAERVLAAENEAGQASPCADVHPFVEEVAVAKPSSPPHEGGESEL